MPQSSRIFPICPRCGSTTTLSAEGGQFSRRCTRCKWFESSGEIGLKIIRGSMFDYHGRYIPLSDHSEFKLIKHSKIADLRIGKGEEITVSGRVTWIGQARAVKTRHGQSALMPCTLEDESGRITLNLWGAQTVFGRVGNILKLFRCYVTSYHGYLQLNVAMNGTIQVL